MTEPVMCPGCGESLPRYPAGGKCPKCGKAIPAPAGGPPAGIEAELARLGDTRKTCPTCGKLLPAGKTVCPTCTVVAEEPVRRGLPSWALMLIVLGVAAVLGIAAYTYMTGWAHQQHVAWVEKDIEDARKATSESRVTDAVGALEKASLQMSWFDEEDPDRARLLAEIDSARKSLRSTAEEKLKEMIRKDEVDEAERLYEREVKSIDTDGSLGEVVRNGVANRAMMQKFRRDLKDAQKLMADGDFAQALARMSELRAEVQDPRKSRGDAAVEIRGIVDKLQTEWVKLTYDKGMELLDDGKLTEAGKWFELGKQFVWRSDVGLERTIKRADFFVTEKKVVGITVNIAAVRVVTPEDVRGSLLEHLKSKLGDEGYLGLAVSGPTDPKAREISRILVLDYKEEESQEFSSATGKKAMGTRIICEVKITSTDGTVLWEESPPVQVQTGVIGAGGEFSEKTLRENAESTFRQAFTAVRIPSSRLAP